MKKSKRFPTSFFLLGLLLASRPCACLKALDFTQEYFLSPDSLELTVRVEKLPLEELRKLLAEGETVGIDFEARLFQKRDGFLSVLGDEMVESREQTHLLRYDRINRVFVLETPSETTYYQSFHSLVMPLSTARFSFSRGQPGTEWGHHNGKAYLKSRISLIKRRLEPPFHLLEPFYPEYRRQLEWKTVEPVLPGEAS